MSIKIHALIQKFLEELTPFFAILDQSKLTIEKVMAEEEEDEVLQVLKQSVHFQKFFIQHLSNFLKDVKKEMELKPMETLTFESQWNSETRQLLSFKRHLETGEKEKVAVLDLKELSPINPRYLWKEGVIYQPQDVVQKDYFLYLCLNSHQSSLENQPSQDSPLWKIIYGFQSESESV